MRLILQYNAKGAGYAGSLCFGWSLPLDERLGQLSDGTALWLSGTGSVVTFARAAEGYRAPAGCVYVLTEEGGGYVLTDRHTLVKHLFNAYGILTATEDICGSRTTLSYDINHRLNAIISPSGKTFIVTLDGDDRIVKIDLPDGNQISYAYDERNRLVSVTDALGGVTSYTYEGACVTAMQDAEGSLWSFGYDAMNRLIRTTDLKGGVSTKAYNAKGWCIRETDAAGAVTAITDDREGQTSTCTYDRMNRMTSATIPWGAWSCTPMMPWEICSP